MPAPPAPPAPPKGGPARKGLVRPGGSLSVDVSGAAGAGGTGPNQLSQASLSQARGRSSPCSPLRPPLAARESALCSSADLRRRAHGGAPRALLQGTALMR
eukprot:4021782-Prymnesium_polylepis.1